MKSSERAFAGCPRVLRYIRPSNCDMLTDTDVTEGLDLGFISYVRVEMKGVDGGRRLLDDSEDDVTLSNWVSDRVGGLSKA